MVLNLDKCIGCHTCSVTCKNVWTSREGVEYAWFNNVETKPGVGYPEGLGKPEALEGRLDAPRRRRDRAAHRRQVARPVQHLRQPGPAGNRRLLRTVHLRLRAFADRARGQGHADGPSAFADHRRADGEDRMGAELGGNPRRRIRQPFQGQQFRRRAEGNLRRVREHLHDVSAAPVRALPQSGLRRRLPVRRHLQARGGRHRPDRPGQVPRLAHVRFGLPLQEDLLQLVVRQIGEVHLLLSRASRRASRPCVRRPASAASAISA